jgi:hypothetical protein
MSSQEVSYKNAGTMTVVYPDYDWKIAGYLPPRSGYNGKAKLVVKTEFVYVAPYTTQSRVISSHLIWY